ncbi:MAG: extracellular solute-binding protein [Anaerolineae bacterium]|nr:extracellular solute-binding protein [Anaerolineae bacterium]
MISLQKLIQFGFIVCIGCFSTLIVACQTSPSEDQTDAIATVTNEVIVPTSPLVQETDPTVSPIPTVLTLTTEQPITLTLWTVEPVSYLAEEEIGRFIDNKLREFDREDSDVSVEYFVKKATGKGGVLDFLRTAGEVAPEILPDVAIISVVDLRQAYFDGVIQPLDGKLDRSIIQDLLPAARRMGTVEDALVGVPMGLEMEHTLYSTLVFTDTPILWTDILSSNVRYLFPAKGNNGVVNDATLSQYYSAGGLFQGDEGNSKIDETTLRNVLTFYEQAREQGIIDASLLEASTTEDILPFYLEVQAGLAQVSVSQYLTERETLLNSDYAPVPVPNETATPVSVMHGWLFVLTTDDVNRQNAALKLIETFLSTSNNVEWNTINKSIPTRDSAYQQIAGDDPYWVFLTEQLNTARPEPSFTDYDRIGRIIQQSIEQVIRGEATAEEATATAIDSFTQ